ncbi:hypothetical protein QCD73_18755, partial [Bacillus sp. PsM16]|uniref:hypothetical protein n=1 Tax=Bacillus sp. PsM16 TaxID=3031172 RepID=UPI00263B69F2
TYDGAGIEAVESAMAMGVRLSMAQYMALRRLSDVVSPDQIVVVFDANRGFITVLRPEGLSARSDLGRSLRNAGFRPHKYDVS